MRQPRVEGSPTKRPAPLRRYRDSLWTLHHSVHPVSQAGYVLYLYYQCIFTTNQVGYVMLQAQI